LNILFICLCGFSTPWTSPIAFHTMVLSNGRRRDIVHNIMFGGFPLKFCICCLCVSSTPWISPIALRTIVGSNGRRRDIVHNIIFYKSLVLILSFIYNPFVLKRAERGFHSFKK